MALKVSPFSRPLHPLPLDRRSTSTVSTEIPRYWSALRAVKPQIMETNRKWGSPSASTTLSYPFEIPWFLPHPLPKGCVPEAGITGVATLATKVAVWRDAILATAKIL